MATTSNMSLELPTVTVTLGPEWATQLNTALTVVDEHDHSDGKGLKVPAAGLNINADLDFQSNDLTSVKALHYTDQSSPLTGGTNLTTTYSVNGDLYFTNGAGTAVQLTSGGSIVTTPSAVTSFEVTNINTDLIIAPADTFSYLIVDTSLARQITLPSASAVTAGRTYAIKDASGNANNQNITIVPDGLDNIDGVNANKVIDSNYSTTWVIADGATNWYIS